jgi:hypothetical protein
MFYGHALKAELQHFELPTQKTRCVIHQRCEGQNAPALSDPSFAPVFPDTVPLPL